MESDNARLISRETEDFRRKAPWFGARHTFAFLGFLGFVNVYAMRVNLSVAIVAMVNNTAIDHNNGSHPDTNSTCPVPLQTNTTHSTSQDGPFDWDEKTQGYVLGSFFYGYVVTQLPGGRLAELYGGKWIFGIGILTTAVFTLITPVAAKYSVYLLIAVRVLEGLGEGVTFPVMHSMLSQWAPPLERTKLVAVIYAGAQFGTVVSLPISGILCDTLGWESVFYVFGGFGIVWFVFWISLVYDSPAKHPFISEAEKDLIEISLGKRSVLSCTTTIARSGSSESVNRTVSEPIRRPIPWKSILTSVPVWAIIVAHCCQNWGFYTLLTELPTYMKQILHFDIKTNAFLSALPYLVMWIVSVSGSYVVDFLRSREYLSTTAARKLANSLAFYIPAASLVASAFVGCQTEAVVSLLCITVGVNGLNYSGFNANHIDIASNFSGTLMGITNMLGNLMGFLAPMAVSAIVQGHEDIEHWQTVFFIAAAVYVFGNSFFLIFGTGVEQSWNKTKEELEQGTTEVDGPNEGPILRVPTRDLIDDDVY